MQCPLRSYRDVECSQDMIHASFQFRYCRCFRRAQSYCGQFNLISNKDKCSCEQYIVAILYAESLCIFFISTVGNDIICIMFYETTAIHLMHSIKYVAFKYKSFWHSFSLNRLFLEITQHVSEHEFY